MDHGGGVAIFLAVAGAFLMEDLRLSEKPPPATLLRKSLMRSPRALPESDDGTRQVVGTGKTTEHEKGRSSMRIVIFGATGKTGHQLVAQALSVGHDVSKC